MNQKNFTIQNVKTIKQVNGKTVFRDLVFCEFCRDFCRDEWIILLWTWLHHLFDIIKESEYAFKIFNI